jgi:hypothetical protein
VALLVCAALLAMAGCGEASGGGGTSGSGTSSTSPSAAGLGAAEPHQLYTHCGVTWTQFQNQPWYASPPLSDGNGNPPPGFGNPVDHGTMRRISQHEAEYVSSAGRTVRFVDALPPGQSPPGLCS